MFLISISSGLFCALYSRSTENLRVAIKMAGNVMFSGVSGLSGVRTLCEPMGDRVMSLAQITELI